MTLEQCQRITTVCSHRCTLDKAIWCNCMIKADESLFCTVWSHCRQSSTNQGHWMPYEALPKYSFYRIIFPISSGFFGTSPGNLSNSSAAGLLFSRQLQKWNCDFLSAALYIRGTEADKIWHALTTTEKVGCIAIATIHSQCRLTSKSLMRCRQATFLKNFETVPAIQTSYHYEGWQSGYTKYTNSDAQILICGVKWQPLEM